MSNIFMHQQLVGALTGPFGAYTSYDASKFKQPFDEHEQVANSFQAQITSAEKRKDSKEVVQLRVRYEKFEEGWRNARKIAGLVAPIEALTGNDLTSEHISELKELLASNAATNDFSLPPKTLGSAYYAVGDFQNALRYLKVASAHSDDSQALALQSSALGELAKRATTEHTKSDYENMAAESFRAAQASPSAKPAELIIFASRNTDLHAILTEKGVGLIHSSAPVKVDH